MNALTPPPSGELPVDIRPLISQDLRIVEALLKNQDTAPEQTQEIADRCHRIRN
jgi:hypothetical protein